MTFFEGDVVVELDKPDVEIEILVTEAWGIKGFYKTTAADGFVKHGRELLLVRHKGE